MAEILENREDRERKRLEALKLYEILDTLPEEEYDDIATLAAEICHTPIAVISIIDGDRHWFKSKVGLDISETDRNFSFCAYAQGQKDVFEVKDLIDNPTFSNHPLVTGYPYMVLCRNSVNYQRWTCIRNFMRYSHAGA